MPEEERGIGVRLPFDELQHGRNFDSAYRAVQGSDPLVTNFAGPPRPFSGCLDYIFFDGLRCQAVLDLPSIDAVRSEVALPNSVHPSDHLPLVAMFSFLGAQRGADGTGGDAFTFAGV